MLTLRIWLVWYLGRLQCWLADAISSARDAIGPFARPGRSLRMLAMPTDSCLKLPGTYMGLRACAVSLSSFPERG